MSGRISAIMAGEFLILQKNITMYQQCIKYFMFHLFSDFEELLESGTLYESKGLTHYGKYLYWTDEIDGSIYQIEKEPPYETRKLISNRQDLRDISVFHRDREMPGESYMHMYVPYYTRIPVV